MRTIGVVTSARSDFGIYLTVLQAIRAHPELSLRIIATGMHLSPEFGLTVQHIEAAGFHVDERVESLLSSDSPEGIGKSVGLGTIGFAQLFARYRPDILLLLGDRFDMYPASIAALPFRIPVAHLHGGEATEGVIDEAIRHSMTKLSHLHFVSAEAYAQRVIQMGEAPWRVQVVGAPSIDNISQMNIPASEEIAAQYNLDLERPLVLATFHPVTLKYEETERQIGELLNALDSFGLQCVFTYPNADTASRIVIERINRYCEEHRDCQMIANVGQHSYFGLMNTVSVMLGNSSSGIIEAASFKLPVVNVGSRQRGRIHAENVIDCPDDCDSIVAALRRALEPEFCASLAGLVNPYGDGYASERIAARLAEVLLNEHLIIKRFYDMADVGLETA